MEDNSPSSILNSQIISTFAPAFFQKARLSVAHGCAAAVWAKHCKHIKL